jgi:hypothetical protein
MRISVMLGFSNAKKRRTSLIPEWKGDARKKRLSISSGPRQCCADSAQSTANPRPCAATCQGGSLPNRGYAIRAAEPKCIKPPVRIHFSTARFHLSRRLWVNWPGYGVKFCH